MLLVGAIRDRSHVRSSRLEKNIKFAISKSHLKSYGGHCPPYKNDANYFLPIFLLILYRGREEYQIRHIKITFEIVWWAMPTLQKRRQLFLANLFAYIINLSIEEVRQIIAQYDND
jgi:hypothetical protein